MLKPVTKVTPNMDTSSCLAPGVVIGLDCVTGLQTSRNLAGHGVPVIGVASDSKHFCCRTNTCKKVVQADTASRDLIVTLEQLGPEFEQKAVLFPCTDASVLLVSAHRRQLEPWYRIVLPPANIVEMCIDKNSFYAYAKNEEWSIPRTFSLSNRVDAEEAAATLTFPCVLKPAVKTLKWKKHTRAKVIYAADAKRLLELYDCCQNWSRDLTVQEWIEGPDSNLTTCYCYFDGESQPVISFVARKIRQWPRNTGTSSLGETCQDAHVRDETIRIFNKIRFRGLGYIEFKRHAKTGQSFIIEPNVGRPGVRSAIAEANGVELVHTMYCDAIGLPLPEKRNELRDSVKWIYWRQDIKSAVEHWWRGELSFGAWKRSLQGPKVCAVFSRSDIRPFWADLCRMFLRRR